MAERASTWTDSAQVANRLDEKQKNHACQGRGVVWHGPNQDQESGRPQEEDQKWQVHLAIEKSKRQSRQEQQSAPPEVGTATARQFFNCNLPNVRPGIAIILPLPTVVEILELLIVVLNRLFRMVPQE